jgi:nucleoside-diphosphate-sugar epimerase
MKIMVTGGTGFLGRAVVEVLTEMNHEVQVLDDNSRGDESLLNTDIHFHKIDIRDTNAVIAATKNMDCIVHLAFINGTRFFYEKPELVTEVGIKGMLNVSDAIQKNGIPELITFSSSEVYQESKVIPTPEDVSLIIPDILNPRFSYGGAKIASELITVHIASKVVSNWKIIRPHNIYGPKMGNNHVVPELIEKVRNLSSNSIEIQGSGKQTRAFCEVRDFKSAFKCVFDDRTRSGIYNIGTTEEVSILELVKNILTVTNKSEIEIRTTSPNIGETPRRCPDISKIQALGFKQEVSLLDGLGNYVRVMK